MDNLKYIFASYDGIGYSIAYKLLQEGKEVLVGQVQDIRELGEKDDKPEKPEVKKRRLSVYNGILKKLPMTELIRQASSIKNKDEWFVICDFNNLWRYADMFQRLGFKNGFFPTKEDVELEKDRDKAKELVKKFFPDLTVGEVHEFKKVADGVKFINENMDQFFVLKGNADEAPTVCPATKHAVLSNQEILTQLEKEAKFYEKSGFILEERIIDPIEMTPEIVFYNGVPLSTVVDIENKPMGAGNKGPQIGCAQNLVFQVPLDSRVCKAAFPQYTHDQAKKHRGLFVADAGLLLKDGKLYFTEFCSQRFGYDSWFTELSMCESVSSFFEAAVSGQNPYRFKFGAAVRGLSMEQGEDHLPVEGWKISWLEDGDKNTWIYDVKKKDGETVTCGNDKDLVVFTGAGNTIESAVNRAYDAEEGFSFSGILARPKEDFLSKAYKSSIMSRYEEGLKNNLF